MKHIARTVFAVTLATAAGSALADLPSSVNETSFLSDSFPHITTYADLHKNDVVTRPSAPSPTSVNETTFFSDSFPQAAYTGERRSDVVKAAGASWPTSVNETTFLSDSFPHITIHADLQTKTSTGG